MRRRMSGRKFSAALSVLTILTFYLPWAAQGYAQGAGATLTGTVTDRSGAVIPKAEISVKNAATGVTRSSETNSAGLYTAPGLPPGNYAVSVTAAGFSTALRTNVTLTVGAQQVLDFTMQVGQVSQNVEVTEEAPSIDLASSTISGSVDQRSVVGLPLNGRSWSDLATLQPGVSSIKTLPNVTNPDRIGRGLGNQLTITGARPQQNNYLINGVSMNDYTNGAPGSMLGGNLGVDAIQEFSVLTTNYSAANGRTSGGVISAVTKSGTNAFHGNAYEFLRNSALDADNFFDNANGIKKPPFRRNQFGASAGGPIRKDKTFVFGDYEGLRQALGVTQVNNVPSPAARNGILCAPPDCSTTTQITVDPLVKPYLAFYPLPNPNVPLVCPFDSCVPGTGDTGIYSFAGSQISTENYFTVRLDHNFSAKDQLFGTYMYDSSPLSQNDEFNNKIIYARTRRQIVTVQENHIFSPSFLNSFRLGFNRSFGASPLSATAVNPLAADTTLGFAPGNTVGIIRVPGLTDFSGGLSTQAPQLWAWNSFQESDDIFLTRGVHSIRFGANVERIQDNSFSVTAPGGTFKFSSLSDFLTNQPSNIRIAFPGLITPRHLRQTIFGAYVQDDIRVFRNLTVNLGLRYEMATVPSETSGKLASLTQLTGTELHLGNPLFANPTLRNFEPRVGLAWDPFHNGKTSVRSGFGMFDVLPLPIELRGAVFAVWPFFDAASLANLPPGSFPIGAFSLLKPDETNARVDYFEPKPPRNYVMQWNLSIQQEITPSTAILVAYVGSRTVHNVLQTDNSDIVLPKVTSAGYLWSCGPDPLPIAGGTGGPCVSGYSPTGTNDSPILNDTLNPHVGAISGTFFNSDAIYHALQVQVTKKMSHGFQAQASYTWSRSIDTSSGSTDGDQFLNGISSLFFFDRRVRRGPSDFNVGQNLVLTYDWNIPTPRGVSGLLAWPLSGWEWGGILTAQGGVPFTPLLDGDLLGLNNTDPFDFPARLPGPGCQSGVNPGNPANYIKLECLGLPTAPASFGAQCAPLKGAASPAPSGQVYCANLLVSSGRNTLVGPGLVTFDMSLFKNIPIKRISETFNVQFRTEFFNILNRPNFSPPTGNNIIFDGDGKRVGNAGAVDSTSTTSRQVQFALKVVW
jgi:Carboxypeptidase regulatory-like domain/TonB-dependent Receptor Plug Domain